MEVQFFHIYSTYQVQLVLAASPQTAQLWGGLPCPMDWKGVPYHRTHSIHFFVTTLTIYVVMYLISVFPTWLPGHFP